MNITMVNRNVLQFLIVGLFLLIVLPKVQASPNCTINTTGDSYIDCNCVYDTKQETTGIIHIRSYEPVTNTTTLIPNGDPLFSYIGWSYVGASSFWQSCQTNDGDTSYAKFVYVFGYNGLTLYHTNLLNGINPPPHEDITISKVRVYAVAKHVASGIPSIALISGSLVGWLGFGRSKVTTTGYATYLLSTYSAKGGIPITVSDVNDANSRISWSGFSKVADARITQTYLEVDWLDNRNSVVFNDGFKAKGYDISPDAEKTCKLMYSYKEIGI